MFAMVEENGEIEMNRLVTKRRIIWKLIANGVKISSHGLGFYTLLHFLIKADDRDLNNNLIPNSAISDGKSNFSFDFFRCGLSICLYYLWLPFSHQSSRGVSKKHPLP